MLADLADVFTDGGPLAVGGALVVVGALVGAYIYRAGRRDR